MENLETLDLTKLEYSPSPLEIIPSPWMELELFMGNLEISELKNLEYPSPPQLETIVDFIHGCTTV